MAMLSGGKGQRHQGQPKSESKAKLGGLGGFSVIKSPVTRRMAEAMPTPAAREVGAEAELTPAEAAGAMKAASETPGREPGGTIPMKSVPVKGSKQGATRELDPRTGKPLAIRGAKEAGAVKRPFKSRWQPPSPTIAKVRAASAAKKMGPGETGVAAGG